MAEPQRVQTPVEPIPGARILIVEARFYDAIGEALLTGARQAIAAAQATADVLTVPGALEIPSTIAITLDAAEKNGRPYDGVVVLGCIIRGETYHFEIVANESSRGVTDLSISRRIPIGNGILTVENEDQAWARASTDRGDKGGDAARAALAVLRIKRKAGVNP